MDENMNNGQNFDANQQMYQQGGQMYGQPDANQQMYQQGGQMYGQPGANQQMYQQGGQMYGQPGANQQMYQQGGQMYGQPDANQQMYQQGGQMNYNQQPSGGSKKPGFDIMDMLKKNKNILILCGAALVALILIICICSSLFGHGKQSPKSVGKAYTQALAKNKPKKLYKLYDKKFIKYMKKEYNKDNDDIMDGMEDIIDGFLDDMDYYDVGDVKKIKCKVTDVEKEKGKDLKDVKEFFKDEYDIKISQCATVEMDWDIKGEDDDIEYEAEVYVYKRMGKWYLFSSGQCIK
ncbi:MAG: hypothetical protein ACI4EF_10405 [Coprococcus sp.]